MPNSSTPEAAADGSEAEAKAAFHLLMRARGIRDLRVLRAFELVSRASFAPPALAHLARRDLPLPIGCGQTLLQPSLLARMIEALDAAPRHHVYEVGAGSGFATAILASLAEEVIGIERFHSLAQAAQRRLVEREIDNAAVIWGDGLVMPSDVPAFDRIIVHGATTVADMLAEQLREGGILVCVEGTKGRAQRVVRLTREAGGDLRRTEVCPCQVQEMIAGAAATL